MGQALGLLVRFLTGAIAAGLLPLAASLALLPSEGRAEGRAEEGAAPTAVTTAGMAGEPLSCPGPECLAEVAPPESVPSTAERESEGQPPSTFWNRPTLTGDWGGDRTRLAEDGGTVRLYATGFYQGQGSGDPGIRAASASTARGRTSSRAGGSTRCSISTPAE
jgi:hypothetical protein